MEEEKSVWEEIVTFFKPQNREVFRPVVMRLKEISDTGDAEAVVMLFKDLVKLGALIERLILSKEIAVIQSDTQH